MRSTSQQHRRDPHLLGLLDQLLGGEGKGCTLRRRARQHRRLHRRHAGGGGSLQCTAGQRSGSMMLWRVATSANPARLCGGQACVARSRRTSVVAAAPTRQARRLGAAIAAERPEAAGRQAAPGCETVAARVSVACMFRAGRWKEANVQQMRCTQAPQAPWGAMWGAAAAASQLSGVLAAPWLLIGGPAVPSDNTPALRQATAAALLRGGHVDIALAVSRPRRRGHTSAAAPCRHRPHQPSFPPCIRARPASLATSSRDTAAHAERS